MTFWDAIIKSLPRTGEYNRDDQVAPAVILWPDKGHEKRFADHKTIGRNRDLKDGVRLNIRPFMVVGVLRKPPNIKWGKDRGKKPPGSPWGEERDNDHHLTPAEKRAARRTE